MSAREKIAYLRGIVEGQCESEKSAPSKFQEALLGALDAVAAEIDGLEEKTTELREYVMLLEDDLSELQSDFDVDDDDDDDVDECGCAFCTGDDDDEEEEYESSCCPACGKDFFYQPAAYGDDEDLLCPHCGEPLAEG